MARDHIKSRASFRSEVWTGKRESVGAAGVRASWPRSIDADLENSDLESEGESASLVTRGAWFVFGLADDAIPYRSPVSSSIIVGSPAGSKLPLRTW